MNKTMKYMKFFCKILIYHFVFFYVICISSYSQNYNVVGGVSIADDTIPPHPSAILEVRSVSKGVLFPGMSYQQMLDSIEIPTLGLTVYVTDTNEYNGIWFYDNGWTQLKFRKAYYPKGAIIMYDGSTSSLYFNEDGAGVHSGTKGWHICNGKNGTPDLRDRFVVGYSERATSGYNAYGASVKNKNTYTLGNDSVPVHKHKIPQFTVSKDYPHNGEGKGHKLETVNKNKIYKHDHPIIYIDGKLGVDPGFEHRRKIKSKKHKELAFDKSTLGLKTEFNNTNNTGNISLSFGEVGLENPVPIDNRPPYYTLVYIMRTEVPYFDFQSITNP